MMPNAQRWKMRQYYTKKTVAYVSLRFQQCHYIVCRAVRNYDQKRRSKGIAAPLQSTASASEDCVVVKCIEVDVGNDEAYRFGMSDHLRMSIIRF